MAADWLEVGQKVHSMFGELFGIGSSLMQVEDHLTMGIPGAEDKLEDVKSKLLAMAASIEVLISEVKS